MILETIIGPQILPAKSYTALDAMIIAFLGQREGAIVNLLQKCRASSSF